MSVYLRTIIHWVSHMCAQKLPNISVESLNSTNFKWASVSEDEKQAYFTETEMRM